MRKKGRQLPLVASLLRQVSCLGSAEAEPEAGILGHRN